MRRRPRSGARTRSSRLPRSLHVRLTAVSVLVIALAFAVAGGALVWRVRASSLAGIDSSLSGRVRDVAAQAANGQLSALSTTGADSGALVQVLDPNGHVLASSANINGEPPLFATSASTRRVTVRSISAIPGADPGDYRLASLRVSTPAGVVTVYAARSLSDITASVNKLIAALLVGAPFLIALLSGIVWILVGRALRPVEAMRQAVREMPGNQPRPRLSESAAPLELARLADTFDDLLDRIEAGAAQQRRFLADAAHELRNPVASVLTRLEIHGSDAALSGEDRARLHADATRLASLVDALLSLARLDAHVAMHAQVLDLDDLVFDHARTVTSKHVDLAHVSAAQVIGDRAALDRVVRNLLDNATRHASATISISLYDDGQSVILLVADDGPGIPPADRERIFERFTRLDDARARDAGGAGLGLAIAHDVVHRHHGVISIEDNHPGACFVVRLPSVDSSEDPTDEVKFRESGYA